LVVEVKDGVVRRFTMTPEDFGVSRAPVDALAGGTPEENAQMIREIFAGGSGPARDIVILNASAALVAAGVAGDFREGAHLAGVAIASGAAREKLAALVAFTNAG